MTDTTLTLTGMEPTVGKSLEPTPPLFFVETATTPQMLGREEGWEWVDVWFDRAGAEELARRHEARRTWVENEEISETLVSVARVLSAAEILDRDGPEGLSRALTSTMTTMYSRLEQLKAGVRFGADVD